MKLISAAFLLLWAVAATGADAPPAAATATPPTPATVPAAPVTPPAPVPAAKEPEARLTAELAARITEGRTIELEVAGRKVLGLYTPQTTARAKGAVLLLHDLGGHADWPGVIAPLRRALPAQGWSTLSIQLPLPDKSAPAAQRGAWLDQVAPRIEAALTFIKGENPPRVVLLGHGLGAAAALDFGAAHPDGLRGVVLVNLPQLRGSDPRLDGQALGRIGLPVLDIFGDADGDEVIATAPQRRQAAGHKGNYLQLAIPGANHFFDGQGATLAARVRGWLDRHTVEATSPAPAATEPLPASGTTTKGTQP